MPDMTPQEISALLQKHFNLDELKKLAFTLGIPYEDLPGASHSLKTIEMVQYAERHGRTADLIHQIRRVRANANLTGGAEPATPATASDAAATPPATPADTPPTNITYNIHGTVVGGTIGGGTVQAENIAGRDIVIGQVPDSREAFQDQLAVLVALIEEAVAKGQLPAEDADAVQEDVTGAVKEAAKEQPSARRLTGKLEYVQEVLEKAGSTVATASKAGMAVIKAAPVVAALLKAVHNLF